MLQALLKESTVDLRAVQKELSTMIVQSFAQDPDAWQGARSRNSRPR
ncbi:hypothetical protein [Variovorax boronicumulans]|nr:hypothetical protein [Variovorax boronicumulans]